MIRFCVTLPVLSARFDSCRFPSWPRTVNRDPETLDRSCSFRRGNFRAAQGTISWTAPEPDFNPLVSFFTLHLADDAFLGVNVRMPRPSSGEDVRLWTQPRFGFNRSQIGSTLPWHLQEATAMLEG